MNDIVKTCGWSLHRRNSIESGHIWIEVLSDCGEGFEFYNDQHEYFNFCPYCGGEMLRAKASE
jgi:rRNA maturation endonuclease Nob1